MILTREGDSRRLSWAYNLKIGSKNGPTVECTDAEVAEIDAAIAKYDASKRGKQGARQKATVAAFLAAGVDAIRAATVEQLAVPGLNVRDLPAWRHPVGFERSYRCVPENSYPPDVRAKLAEAGAVLRQRQARQETESRRVRAVEAEHRARLNERKERDRKRKAEQRKSQVKSKAQSKPYKIVGNCEDCRFWHAARGECHNQGPRMFEPVAGEAGEWGTWPKTRPKDFCGWFGPREHSELAEDAGPPARRAVR